LKLQGSIETPQKVHEESSASIPQKQANLSFKAKLTGRVSIRNGVTDTTK
tara:strand:+ start:226 stop:375 length:150 start_codon:yes stop_codon:yes gene_type:complete